MAKHKATLLMQPLWYAPAMSTSPSPAPEGKKQTEKGLRAQIRESRFKRLKTYSWRLTAGYLWFRVAALLVFGPAPIENFEQNILEHIATFVSSIGFAPVNVSYFGPILKIGWVLIITEFSFFQIVGGVFYVISFPLVAGFLLAISVLLRGSLHRDSDSGNGPTTQESEDTSKRWPYLSICVLMLVAWFLLYGAANTRKQIIPGVILSAWLLLLLVIRAFRRARPYDVFSIQLIKSAMKPGSIMGQTWKSDQEKRAPLTKTSALMAFKIASFLKGFYVRLALFIRGRQGKERVSGLVLIDYVVTMLLLGVAAVLFWSMIVKLFAVPNSLSIQTCLQITASHFLPNLARMNLEVPTWIEIGTSLTAWVLFVLYVGPAASIIPARQQAYAESLKPDYRLLILLISVIRGWRHRFDEIRKGKNPQVVPSSNSSST